MTDSKKHDDEEIAIDLSKIKGWFKKKGKKEHKHEEKHEHHTHAEHAEHSEHHAHEEHSTHHHEHKTREEKEETLGLKESLSFFKKYATIFLILIPVILTIVIRLQPMYLPATDSWAQSSVYNYYKSQIGAQVDQQYPNLPSANKQAMVETEFAKFLEQNKDMIQQQVEATSQGFKDRMMYESGNSKYVYLGDIDSYFWLREVRKLEENGTVCDEVDYQNQICYWDTYTQAPLKGGSPLKEAKASPYSYTILYVHKVGKLFNPDLTLMQAAFYTPLIYAIISAILAFLIGKAISGNLAGLITSIIISVNPIALSRTLGSDNDPINMLFPLLTVIFFIHAFKTKDWKMKIGFGAATGLSIGLYAWAWQGWWFIFDFIVGAMLIYAAFQILRLLIKTKKLSKAVRDSEVTHTATAFLVIIASSAAFIAIFTTAKTFLNAILSPFWFMQTKVAALQNFWPNVLVTVAEFNPGSLGTVVSQMGGKLMFFLGLMGVILIIFKNEEKLKKEHKYLIAFAALVYLLLVSDYGINMNPITYMALLALPVAAGFLILLKTEENIDIRMALLLVIWFIATTYAALKGVRFTLLMVSAFGVAFGVTISFVYKRLVAWVSSELKINELLTKSIVVILLLLVLISPVKAGYYTASSYIPSVNDAWYDTLTKINQNSSNDAIINSWWDFGHWFKYIADRRVTLDGSSQGGPPLHWLGKLMVTDNESMSVGILRMLDCGSNTAFDKLNPVINDTSKSIDILDEIVTLEKKDAGQYLLDQGLTKTQATDVLKYTHCDPPEDFFITSEDMVGKAGVWAHFGSWDFQRAEMYIKVKGSTLEEGKSILMSPEYNLTESEAEQYYYEIQTQDDNQWITPWPGYMSGVQACETPRIDGTMICNQALSNGQQIPLVVNLTNYDVTIPAKEAYRPTSVVYITENGTEEKKFTENTLDFSLVLVPSGDGYSSLVTHPYLANSMFTRLFYLNGHGLRNFDKFDDQRGVTGGRIIVWKVDWEGNTTNYAYSKMEVNTEDVVTDTETASTNASKSKTPTSSNKTKAADVNSTGNTGTNATNEE
ncbi:hypothetical protein KY363_04630 [Candidatus Woesearchaeota archaeon]|nr:hypothetical protein [Candidatus Woesearchaeota archaeon]